VVNENAEPAPRTGPELRHDAYQVVDAAEVLDDDTLDAQVLAPHLRDEFRVVAALDVDSAGAGDPGADTRNRDRSRRRSARRGRRSAPRCGEDHRTALEQVPRTQGKTAGATVSVFQVDAAIFHSDHRADVATFYVLDDHAEFNRLLSRERLAPTRGEYVGSIAIDHSTILKSLPAKTVTAR
jgi:hypothetical protein